MADDERTSVEVAATDPAALSKAERAEGFEKAPGRAEIERQRSGRRSTDYEDGGTRLAERVYNMFFSRDKRSDAPGSTVDVDQPGSGQIERAERKARAQVGEMVRNPDGTFKGKATQVVTTKNGSVQLRDKKGRILKVVSPPARNPETGRAVTGAELEAGRAKGRTGGVERNALPRVVRMAKSFHQGRPTSAQLQAWWQGYKEAHPEARGTLEVRGDVVAIVDGTEDLSTTRLSQPREWRS